MSLEVPGAVADYLAAEKVKDADKLALCFAEDGVVQDEGHTHQGRDAIRRWKREADAKYQFVMEPLGASVDQEVVTLRARLTGNFPGSPAELGFRFTLADGEIAALKIG